MPSDFRHVFDRPDAQEFLRHTNAVMGSIARGLEQYAFDDTKAQHQLIQEIYLDLQKIIFRYKASAGRLYARNDFDEAVHEASEGLRKFYDNAGRHVLRDLQVRIPKYKVSANYVFLHPDLHDSGTFSLGDALSLLMLSFDAAVKDRPYFVRERTDPEFEGLDSARKKIPAQKVAPAQFDVIDGVLTVVDQKSQEKPESDAAIAASLDALIQNKNEIIEDLVGSNCDKRIAEQIERVGDLLLSQKNVVRLGLENITARLTAASLKDELPNVLAARIEGFSSGVAMYVAQFAEWQTFVQNAAEAAIEEESTDSLTDFVSELLDEMAKNRDVVDESVPSTIRFLSDLISDPSSASRKAVFAFVRTIENLIIKTFGFVIDTVQLTAEKTTEKFSEAASTALVAGLTGVGLVGAAGILPVAIRVKGLEWIQATYQIVREQIAPFVGVF